jgi:ATP synthase protein I
LPASLTTPSDADTPVVSLPGDEPGEQPSPGTAAASAAAELTIAPSGDPEPASTTGSDNGMEFYARLQRRLLIATACAIAAAVPLAGVLYDGTTALSLLLGGACGLLYLRLLARSVSRLGGDRRSVGKFQLLVPVVLVLAAARIPALQIVPALLGFLLYKPALIVQALLDR